ncbi:hypothetical protein SUDANB106_02418 [Streptomyces sp. enrichment culture]|uniref:hypothetical protein n=1 Tax=Streptomyces sp. enrichment culture TaxID=1795815 RepID=UPI003F54FB2E
MPDAIAWLFTAVAVAAAVCGAVELVTGWIMPWERDRVLRPVPHGIGLLLLGGGLLCLAGAASFAAPPGGVLPEALAAGAALFAAGTALRGAASFPDRGGR